MTPVRPVIMCGGSGTRLWPLSRKSRPKHLLPLLGGRSLLQDTATRLTSGMVGIDILPPLVITGAAQADAVANQLKEAGVEPAAILIEPAGRNTAAVAAAAVAWSDLTNDAALLLLLPSDHHIARPDAFAEAIASGVELAKGGRIVTFGIVPDRPHTGYGYIRRGDALGDGFAIDRFVEKPDADTASAYLAEGGYSWNAGIFLFKPATMAAELEAHAPEIAGAVRSAVSGARRAESRFDLDPDAFACAPSAPIDKAVMEKTARAAVILVDMGWSDVGSWSSLFEVLCKDKDGNAVSGPARVIECRSAQVRSTGTLTAVVGVDNVSVIVTDDVVLVIANECSEDVRKVVDGLSEGEAKDLL